MSIKTQPTAAVTKGEANTVTTAAMQVTTTVANRSDNTLTIGATAYDSRVTFFREKMATIARKQWADQQAATLQGIDDLSNVRVGLVTAEGIVLFQTDARPMVENVHQFLQDLARQISETAQREIMETIEF